MYYACFRFGTPSDYFDLARKRTTQFPTLNGDFYVYSDIFSSGYPAYWSGYFTTRPYMKQLSRHVEASLRSAEILFSLTYPKHKEELVSDYPTKLAVARQHLALFQHHDAITGTGKTRQETKLGNFIHFWKHILVDLCGFLNSCM